MTLGSGAFKCFRCCSNVYDMTWTSATGGTAEAIRVGMMGLDLWVARVVDKVIRRKHPRELEVAGYDVTASEVRLPRSLR